MAENDPKDTHPYYKLDAGSPHTQPEDYEKLGLGPFDPNQGTRPIPETATPEDRQLREDIAGRLSGHPQLEGSRLEVHVAAGNAVLTGIVGTRFAKERAEELAREVEGVTEVDNRLVVQTGEETGGPTLTSHEPGANTTGSTQRS